MIISINSANLNLIGNHQFREDAERYIRIHEQFMNAVCREGIGVDTDEQGMTCGMSIDNRDLQGIETLNYGNSLSYGFISPACLDCRTGEYSKTVFQTLRCNRDCYFCANMNQENYDLYQTAVNDAYAELISSEPPGGYKSIALTGGEPLMLADDTLKLLRKCRERYPEAYLRLYTNGDYLTAELAAELSSAGLDEIRISIKLDDCGYPQESVAKIEMATSYIKVVLVEMPVIPGTLEQMKHLLLKLDSIGCKGINILEFLYPWVNNDQYKSNGFKVKNNPYKVLYAYDYSGGLPVSGSREECLKLLEFAVSNELNMGVHYCSLENKLTAQIYMQNHNLNLMSHEVRSSKDYFIKTARAYGSDALIVNSFFEQNGLSDYEWSGSGGAAQIEFHPNFISSILGITEVALCYNVAEYEDGNRLIREIKLDLIRPDEFDYENDI